MPISMLTNSLMPVLFILLMADGHTGNPVHEWLGLFLTGCVVLHIWLNRTWYRSLCKGPYTTARTFRLLLNMLLLFFMIGTLTSAVLISRTVFAFATFDGGLLTRTVHVFCAHWCFLIAALHLGVYSRRFLAVLGRHVSRRLPGRYGSVISGIKFVIAAYGAYAFHSRELISPLLMRSAFMPWSDSAVLFVLDYCTIFFLCVWACRPFSSLPSFLIKPGPVLSPTSGQSHKLFNTDTCRMRSNS